MPRETLGEGDFQIEVAWGDDSAQLGVTTTNMASDMTELRNVGGSGIGLWADLDVDKIIRLRAVLARVLRRLEA